MKLGRQKRGYCACILSAMTIFLIASCGRAGSSSDAIILVTPSSGEPAVAYGSSLDEWEDATQANADTTQGEDVTDEPTQSTSNLAAPAPISPIEPAAVIETEIGTPFILDNVEYREIMWDGLIPLDFTPDAIMSKYQKELDALEDGSPEVSELYSKMQEEYNSAPVNEVLNEVEIRIPGFVTPLDYTDGIITEFLLVPNLGACIHVPPPPINQTVLVRTAEGHGIKIEDSYDPIWVMGKIVTEGTTTELASAGYNIQEAIIEPYQPVQ